MIAKNLAQVLYNKLNENRCAPFYIVSSSSTTSIDNFIKEFNSRISQIDDHPDILSVDLNKDENSYNVESLAIKKFQHFLNYKPLKLNKKIIYFKNADKINNTLANKLLKTLEELADHFLVIFFVSQLEDVLPTILSRAIKLTLLQDPTQPIQQSLQNDSTANLLNAIRLEKDKLAEYELTKMYLTQHVNDTLKHNNYKKCEHLLSSLKHFEISQEFNNALLPRLSLFSES